MDCEKNYTYPEQTPTCSRTGVRSGDTPLICATKYAEGKTVTVKLLVDAGTDLRIQDNKGKTALDYAKEKEQQEAMVLLR